MKKRFKIIGLISLLLFFINTTLLLVNLNKMYMINGTGSGVSGKYFLIVLGFVNLLVLVNYINPKLIKSKTFLYLGQDIKSFKTLLNVLALIINLASLFYILN